MWHEGHVKVRVMELKTAELLQRYIEHCDLFFNGTRGIVSNINQQRTSLRKIGRTKFGQFGTAQAHLMLSFYIFKTDKLIPNKY